MTRPTLTTVALAAALTLSGCSGISAGDAATIGGRMIDEQELQVATTQLNEIAPEPSTPGALISELVRTPILDEALAGSDLALTDQEVRDLLREAGLDDPNDVAVDVARTREYLLRLQDPALAQEPANADVLTRLNEVTADDFAALDVQVSPRYGTWDPTDLTLLDQAPEWITPAG